MWNNAIKSVDPASLSFSGFWYNKKIAQYSSKANVVRLWGTEEQMGKLSKEVLSKVILLLFKRGD